MSDGELCEVCGMERCYCEEAGLKSLLREDREAKMWALANSSQRAIDIIGPPQGQRPPRPHFYSDLSCLVCRRSHLEILAHGTECIEVRP